MVSFCLSINLTTSLEISYIVNKKSKLAKHTDTILTYTHFKAIMVIRVAHISVVEKPNVSHVQDLIIWSCEEFFEVLCGFDQITKPDQSWEITSVALKEFTSQSNLIGTALMGGLYKTPKYKSQQNERIPTRRNAPIGRANQALIGPLYEL